MVGWIHSLWNTPDGLARLFYASQWAMAVLGILTALAIGASIVVSQRRDSLLERQNMEAEERISFVQHQVEDSNRNLSDIKAGETRRSLSEEQRKELHKILTSRKGESAVIITQMGDVEATLYARDFAYAFLTAGWKVNHINPNALFNKQLSGVFVATTNAKHPSETSEYAFRALEKVGVKVRWAILSGYVGSREGLVLLIGHKE